MVLNFLGVLNILIVLNILRICQQLFFVHWFFPLNLWLFSDLICLLSQFLQRRIFLWNWINFIALLFLLLLTSSILLRLLLIYFFVILPYTLSIHLPIILAYILTIIVYFALIGILKQISWIYWIMHLIFYH